MRTTFAVVLIAVAVLFFSMIWEDEVVAGEGVPGIPSGPGGHAVTQDIEMWSHVTGTWEEWNSGGCGGACGESSGPYTCIHPDRPGYFWSHAFDCGDGTVTYNWWWMASGEEFGRAYDSHMRITFLADENGNPTGEAEFCEWRVYRDEDDPRMRVAQIYTRAWRNKGQ